MKEFESCDKCKYNKKSETEYPCNQCVHNATDKFKPMTYADKIRSMSDEELAGFLRGIETGVDVCGKYFEAKGTVFLSAKNSKHESLTKEIFYWLQSEAE